MNNLVELTDWQKAFGFKKPKKKIRIYYDPNAYAKTVQLIYAHPVEIGWNMVMDTYKDGYKVYNILVYPQKVSPAFISVDLPKYGLWKANLDEKIEEKLNGQAHSHVNMGTFASITDIKQQHDEILSKNKGYYFFQIWNKHNSVNSFFYDIDNMIYYTKQDIELIMEGVDDFVTKSFDMIDLDTPAFNDYEVGEDFGSEQVI